nr:DUF1993 family protein [uncultured Duganella sp.]
MHAAVIFHRSLAQLYAMLGKIGAADADHGGGMLEARLHQDMLPFAQHVRATANFALRGCCPLAGVPVVSFDGDERSFAALEWQIVETMRCIADLAPGSFDTSPQHICRDRAGFADLALGADEYLNLYILPNFYFHFSMVYAIARSRGVAIGKGDFDGYHIYAPGFSFERPAPG